MDAGPVHATGMGVTGLPWSEIMAWGGGFVAVDEAETIRAMSSAYAAELHRADGKNVEAPFTTKVGGRRRRG